MTPAAQSDAQTAYLLVTHGSRDPRSQAGAAQLAEQLREHFGLNQWPATGQNPSQNPSQNSSQNPSQNPGQIAAITTAVLELGPAPLHRQIEQFARQVAPFGVTSIKLLPLFLLPGVHVREDLPEELAQAQTALAQSTDTADIALALLPHIGAEDALLPVLRSQQQALLEQLSQQHDPSPQSQLVGASTGQPPAEPHRKSLTVNDVDWALLAHGSRRTGAVEAIANLAHRLGARPAYWVGSPSLTDCIEIQRARGTAHQPRPLGCLSYFLFEGGITDRLALQLDAAAADGPAILSAPLGAFSALADVVADAMERSLDDAMG